MEVKEFATPAEVLAFDRDCWFMIDYLYRTNSPNQFDAISAWSCSWCESHGFCTYLFKNYAQELNGVYLSRLGVLGLAKFEDDDEV